MRKLGKKLRLLALSALLALACGGCLFQSAEDLYLLPSLPEGYASLQTAIQETMDELGAEYANISYGGNTSTIQLQDLDGDGRQETAVVFLRLTAAQEKPLRVCLFRQGADGSFSMAHEIAGDGTSIHSVSYEDLTGDGVLELVIGWQMSTRVHILTAHMIGSSGAVELMNATYNDSYLVTDMDGDAANGKAILLMQQNSTGEAGGSRAEYYRYQDGVMALTYTAPLSDSIAGGVSARAGLLSDGQPCVYVTAQVEGGALTDILYLDRTGLHNLTRDGESGVSASTFRAYTDVAAADINNDGVLEIPQPVQLPDPQDWSDPAGETGEGGEALRTENGGGEEEDGEEEEQPAGPSYYVILWRQFDSQGNAAVSCSTYHSVSDGWYLMLPDDWPGNITVSRDDSRSSRGERAVVFYYWPGYGREQPVPFLTVYTLTGNNRETWANRSGRFVLRTDDSAIYAAALDEEIWACGVSQEQLSQRFRLITTAWSSQ